MRRSSSMLAYGLLLAGIVILCGDFLWRGRVFSGVDLVNYFLPTADFGRIWLKQGVLPLWNPTTFCGWPLVGDPQLRWLYPPNLLLLAMDPRYAFSLLMFVDIAFGATGMWFYLRRAAGVGPWPALCGAATLGLAGFFANHLMSGIVVFPATAAWVPWILLFGWRVGQRDATARSVALLALAIGAQVLSGSPQIVFYTWIALILQAIWCVVAGITLSYGADRSDRSERSDLPDRFGHVGAVMLRYFVAGALGVALSASSIIPSSEFGALSFQRGEKPSWESVTDCSIAPRYFWLTVAPRFFGDPRNERTYWGGIEGYWDICGYDGIGPLVGLLIVIFSWRFLFGGRAASQKERDGRVFATYHLVLAGLAFFLALGRYNPVFRLLYEWVPGFDRFRVPGRWLLFWQFGLATLLAMVLEKSFGGKEGNALANRRVALVAGVFSLLLILAALSSAEAMRWAGIARYYPQFDPASGRYLDLQLRNWAAGSFSRAAAFAAAWTILFIVGARINLRWRRGALVLAALLVLTDTLTYGRWVVSTRTLQGQVDEFYPRSPLIQFLSAGLDGNRRFLATDSVGDWRNDQNQPELWANRAAIYGLHDARGYYPLCLRWFGHLINALSHRAVQYSMGGLLSVGENLNPALLSMLNVKFLLSYEDLKIQGLRLAQQTDFGLRIYGVQTTRGPVFLAKARPTDGMTDEQEIVLLTSPIFDPQKYALATGPKPERVGDKGQAGPSSVEYVRPTPDRIELGVEAGDNDLVVVSEAYHPGWKARVDGAPSHVVRANHALIGVYVPPGRHRIVFVFRPSSFRIGLYLSFIACGIIAGLRVATRRRARL